MPEWSTNPFADEDDAAKPRRRALYNRVLVYARRYPKFLSRFRSLSLANIASLHLGRSVALEPLHTCQQ